MREKRGVKRSSEERKAERGSWQRERKCVERGEGGRVESVFLERGRVEE